MTIIHLLQNTDNHVDIYRQHVGNEVFGITCFSKTQHLLWIILKNNNKKIISITSKYRDVSTLDMQQTWK